MIKQLKLAVLLIATAVCLLVYETEVLFAGKKKNKNQPTADSPVTETTNIHYTGKYCEQCHQKRPKEGGNPYLKHGGDVNQLCRCHVGNSRDYIHPVGIVPSKESGVKIPDGFPLINQKISCITCHDIYLQCQKRLVEKISLRGTPYQKRTDFCFRCHNQAEYMMLDAHKQLNKAGEILTDICFYCHAKKPDEKRDRIDNLKFIGNLEELCQRCHMIRGNHSGNFNHMVKPSVKALAKIEIMKKKFDIILPMDEKGKITCITCHNPHQKGVIPAEKASARGADSKHRHRLPGKMCIECHQM